MADVPGGRERLEELKREHTNLDRYGEEMTYCTGCERGPWPCTTARLITALEEALSHVPQMYEPAVFSKLVSK